MRLCVLVFAWPFHANAAPIRAGALARQCITASTEVRKFGWIYWKAFNCVCTASRTQIKYSKVSKPKSNARKNTSLTFENDIFAIFTSRAWMPSWKFQLMNFTLFARRTAAAIPNQKCITCVFEDINPWLCIFIVHHLSVVYRGYNSFHKLQANTVVNRYVCVSVCLFVCLFCVVCTVSHMWLFAVNACVWLFCVCSHAVCVLFILI